MTSSTGNALEYSKTFVFIPKFFINNDKVSEKFRQSCSKYVQTGWLIILCTDQTPSPS